jgi:hypothetical protein
LAQLYELCLRKFSLSIMYDAIGKMMQHGVLKGATSWCKLEK